MRLNSDHLQAFGTLAAALAALIALFVAWDQGRVMRQEIRASVWPALQIDGFVSSDARQTHVGLRIQNAGVGPARLDALTLRYRGELIADLDALSALFPGYVDRSVTVTTGRLLAAGDTVEVFAFGLPHAEAQPETADAEPAVADAVQMMTDLATLYDIEVCYCSVLDECWIALSSGSDAASKPQSVNACPVDGVSNL